MKSTIKKIWLTPPMAFARIGSSDTPMDAYYWSENNPNPKGSNKTTIVPAPTLTIDADGNLGECLPKEIRFKEVTDKGEIFRPVCPWYELHGTFTTDDGSEFTGPVTNRILADNGLTVHDIQWSIHVENRKSFQMTLDEETKIIGKVTVRGDDTIKKDIKGYCPDGSVNPLVPVGRSIAMGAVQVAKLDDSFPEVRIRITPSKGVNYGPEGLRDKIVDFINKPNYTPISNEITDDWKTLEIPDENLFLNPLSNWCTYQTDGGDGRTQPGSLFSLVQLDSPDVANAKYATWYSLGIVDDVSDGIISCAIVNKAINLKAQARVVICPQDFAPDRRHVATLADNFKDRADHVPIEEAYEGVPYSEIADEIQDIFTRIFETMNFMNLDILNLKNAFQNPVTNKPPFDIPASVLPLPLTQIGRQRHRRFVALQVLETIMREEIGREDAALHSKAGYPVAVSPIIKMLNAPLDLRDDGKYKDNLPKRMPALMRASDGTPYHLTRRQYELVLFWIKKMREKILKEIDLKA